MPSTFTILALLRFLVSWSIASTTYQSSYNIIDGGDVLHGYDLTIEDKDVEHDLLPEEDYLDYDIWSNETKRNTRQDAYNSVTKSSTGNYLDHPLSEYQFGFFACAKPIYYINTSAINHRMSLLV